MVINLKSKRGFTLVELVVVMAIIAIFATVLLGNRSQYSESLALNKEAYNVVLHLRQAQVYGLGVKGAGSPASFGISYGVSLSNVNSNLFYFFTDANNNGINDAGDTPSTINYTNSVTLKKICATPSSGAQYSVCNTGPYGADDPARVDVTFSRPTLAAKIRLLSNTNVNTVPALFFPVRIELQNAAGNLSKFIIINSTGQISIQ